jgi:hypothetical protein
MPFSNFEGIFYVRNGPILQSPEFNAYDFHLPLCHYRAWTPDVGYITVCRVYLVEDTPFSWQA